MLAPFVTSILPFNCAFRRSCRRTRARSVIGTTPQPVALSLPSNWRLVGGNASATLGNATATVLRGSKAVTSTLPSAPWRETSPRREPVIIHACEPSVATTGAMVKSTRNSPGSRRKPAPAIFAHSRPWVDRVKWRAEPPREKTRAESSFNAASSSLAESPTSFDADGFADAPLAGTFADVAPRPTSAESHPRLRMAIPVMRNARVMRGRCVG